MNKLSPISWKELIRKLHRLGFEGPYREGKHPYMIKGGLVLTIPNPHRREIGVELLSRLLKQAGINRDNWTKAN